MRAPPTDASGFSSSPWPTPRVSMVNGSSAAEVAAGDPYGRLECAVAVKPWPTPSAGMHNDAEAPESWMARAELLKAKHGNGNGAGMPLAVAAKLSASPWPTPNASKASNDTTLTCSGDGRETPNKLGWAVAWATPQAHDAKGTEAGALNPHWVESLMGFPAGWTRTDGPQAAAKSNTSGKRRASRKPRPNGGTG